MGANHEVNLIFLDDNGAVLAKPKPKCFQNIATEFKKKLLNRNSTDWLTN